MSETKRDYQIGYGKPPRGRPFQKGQSGNPRGKDLSALPWPGAEPKAPQRLRRQARRGACPWAAHGAIAGGCSQ